MKLPQIKQMKWNYLALAFLLPFIGLLLMMLLAWYQPFGSTRSMLYSDMYHQYFPFFVSFRKAILSGDSLLYNWDIGMGLDHLGLISYYLASPLNLLSVLVPEGLLLKYFALLMPIKLGLASLFFAIFLKNIFRKDDLSITLFGSLYALCAWALGYQWNVMWLDTFALLPLVALGTVSLLKDKKFVLYTVTLFLSICCNYYIGFFTCIFVLLLFICYQICRFQSLTRFLGDLFRIALFSVLAIGMTAFLELPALAALQTTQSSVNNFPEGFKLNIADKHTWKGLLDAMRQVAGQLGGSHTPSFKEGLPNLYCGIGTLILSFLYLTCKQVRIRDRICSVILLLFFMVSFIIRQLDYIWHGFHFTNMIPYRFSFLFSFVLLYMAYRAYLLRRRWKTWQIITAGVLALGVLACSDSRTQFVYIVYNAVFLLLYLGVFLYPKLIKKPTATAEKKTFARFFGEVNQRRSLCAYMLAGVFAVEMIVMVVNFTVSFPYTGISNYPKGKTDTKNVLEYMESLEKDSLFYRTEVTHSQTLNDSALNGYSGISTFTSSANVRVTEFIRALGYSAKNTYNRYLFEESSPVANLFLGLKYMVERDGQVEENPYFEDVYSSGNVHLLKNNAYLPLGFMTQPQLVNVDFNYSTDPFTMQNRLLSAATGVESNVWYRLGSQHLQVTGKDVQIGSVPNSTYTTYTAQASGGYIVYNFNIDTSGLMCIRLNLPKKNNITVFLNGTELYRETYSLPQTFSVAYVRPGDLVQIKLSCKANEKGNTTVTAAILDDTKFQAAYDRLSQSTLELTEFRNTFVEGQVTCTEDGLLYTSIPQNGNWRVFVDGIETEIALVGNAMIGVPLSQGTHTVTFRYDNRAFSLGWKISLGCVMVFAILSVVSYTPKRYKGKYEV